jgi:hypothetical protein
METRRRDITLLLFLGCSFLAALFGRSGLGVDVENLAMKSVGTPERRVEDERRREFGDDPGIVLLVQPLAPGLLHTLDEEEIAGWILSLRARPEVVELVEAAAPQRGEHVLVATLARDAEGRYAGAVDALQAWARDSLPATYGLALTSGPVVEIAIAQALVAERGRILPLILGALALALAAIYRRPLYVIGALAAPLLGVLVLDSLQALLGLAVDPVSALLGPTLLTVGVAASVHVLEHYRGALRRGAAVLAATRAATRELRLPFLLTSTTTIAGFLGLLSSPIPAVRRFGILASVGVVLVHAVALIGLPSLLRLRSERSAAAAMHTHTSARHARFVQRWSLPIVTACALLAVASVGWSARLRADNDPLHILPAAHRVRQDTELVAQELGGTDVFELLLPPTAAPASLLAVMGLSARVCALDGVVGPAGMPRTSEAGYRLLSFLIAPGGSSARAELFGRAELAAREAGWPEAHATGLAVSVARDSNALVRAQWWGILATLASLWILMSLGFRSIALGLLGLVPNAVPVLFLYGGLGLVGQPLTVASSMIGTVMLGLIVDNTIHILHAWRGAVGSRLQRVGRALERVGRPITISTGVLCLGFAAGLGGRLVTTREFAWLAVTILVIALLADLVLLPALLALRWPSSARSEVEPASLPTS